MCCVLCAWLFVCVCSELCVSSVRVLYVVCVVIRVCGVYDVLVV